MGGRVPRFVRIWPVVFGVALGVSLLPATPAAAHNSLTGSDPRNGARLAAAPARIELRFLAKLDAATTKVTVTGPDNVAAAGGAPTFSGSRVSVPFRPGAAGLYIVGYRVASSDGHPIDGEIRFTLTTGTPAESVAPPTGAASAAPGAPSSAEASPGGSAPAVPSPVGTSATGGAPAGSPTAVVPAARESADSDGRGWLWALGAVLALAAATAATLILRRRHPRP
ncbi:copper resistance CopC family protein [Micromonospora endolithica]|uniref:Copper resistance protein CopC n=1 Tax=Micromonospora endolithica TaxID=230091 RepID=A0A3A9ZS18_9ACTN|nr:copper resistance CopC family protein [Micromonospora endolithica]RKN50995.1 copper resistance protein CopC [Micromonospora endolithica]TWJ20218.1 hypothetical protein JD76_00314 [Micromonospora endolithica]